LVTESFVMSQVSENAIQDPRYWFYVNQWILGSVVFIIIVFKKQGI